MIVFVFSMIGFCWGCWYAPLPSCGLLTHTMGRNHSMDVPERTENKCLCMCSQPMSISFAADSLQGDVHVRVNFKTCASGEIDCAVNCHPSVCAPTFPELPNLLWIRIFEMALCRRDSKAFGEVMERVQMVGVLTSEHDDLWFRFNSLAVM